MFQFDIMEGDMDRYDLWLHMDAEAAGAFATATTGRSSQLRPRLVDAGVLAGRYVLPERVKTDPAFADIDFSGLPVVEVDPLAAWPLGE